MLPTAYDPKGRPFGPRWKHSLRRVAWEVGSESRTRVVAPLFVALSVRHIYMLGEIKDLTDFNSYAGSPSRVERHR